MVSAEDKTNVDTSDGDVKIKGAVGFEVLSSLHQQGRARYQRRHSASARLVNGILDVVQGIFDGLRNLDVTVRNNDADGGAHDPGDGGVEGTGDGSDNRFVPNFGSVEGDTECSERNIVDREGRFVSLFDEHGDDSVEKLKGHGDAVALASQITCGVLRRCKSTGNIESMAFPAEREDLSSVRIRRNVRMLDVNPVKALPSLSHLHKFVGQTSEKVVPGKRREGKEDRRLIKQSSTKSLEAEDAMLSVMFPACKVTAVEQLHNASIPRRTSIGFRRWSIETDGGVSEGSDGGMFPQYHRRRNSGGLVDSARATRFDEDSCSLSIFSDDSDEQDFLPPESHRYLPKILLDSYAIRKPYLTSDASGAGSAFDLRLRLQHPQSLPEYVDLHGSMLILDVFGFTPLGEQLRHELGDGEGAAEFARRVDHVLSTMVKLVYDYGGDVLMFAGDALICLFEDRRHECNWKSAKIGENMGIDSRLTMAECCLQVLVEVAACGDKGKEFHIHGGGAYGLVRCFFLGQPSTSPGDCAFLVSGYPLRRAGNLLDKALRGQVLIDGLDRPITVEDGMLAFLRTALPSGGAKNGSTPDVDKEAATMSRDMEEAQPHAGTTSSADLKRFDVHPYARAYLVEPAARRCEYAENALSILLNELRPVAIVFVGLHDLDNIDARDATLLGLMNDVFVSLSLITHSCNGAVRDMLFDDKGCVFISVFGAYSHEVNPCFDATICAMRTQAALKDLEMQHFALGVSFGDCFCGEVGPDIRADYVVMGPEVNMAARLMGKAPNREILVTKRIYNNSKGYVKFLKSEKIKVKGKDVSFHAFIPLGRIERIEPANVLHDVFSVQQPFISTPSREIGLKSLLDVMHTVATGPLHPQVAFLTGGPFLGKSRLIRKLSEKAIGSGFRIFQSFRTPLDTITSYFPFRQIVSMALKECATCVLGENTESQDELSAIMQLITNGFLKRTDRVILGSVVPTVTDCQLLSLLKGQNPKALTKSIVASLMKVLRPLQPLMIILEGEGDIDPSSWNLMVELMSMHESECSRFMLVISSRRLPTVPTAASNILSVASVVKLTPLEMYETDMYLQELLGIRNNGINVDEKLLHAVHDRANGCPLYIEYILKWALDNDMIEYIDGTSKISFRNVDGEHSTEACTVIPRKLSSIFLATFNDVSPVLWDALKIASCLGYSFDAKLYEVLTGDVHFTSKIEDLALTYDTFDCCGVNWYKWKHQAVYEAVKSLLVENQRTQIHKMIVDRFQKTKVDLASSRSLNGDVYRALARHCTFAEKWECAFEHYVEAGKIAEDQLIFTEAANMYGEALVCQGKIPPKPRARLHLLAAVRLGSCLRELARYRDSEVVLTRCLKDTDFEKLNVGDKRLYVEALSALAALKQTQRKYNEAKGLYEKALPMAGQIQKSHSSPWLASKISGYAEALRKSGNLISAERFHRNAVDVMKDAFDHKLCTEFDLAVSITQLGCTVYDRNNFEEAYNLHRRALLLRFKSLSFSHALVAESLKFCAESLCMLGRAVDGIPFAIHAVEIFKVLYGIANPSYAQSLGVLASCYHAVGRSCDALYFMEQCLEICEEIFPDDHLILIPNLMNYGKVLRSVGSYEHAREIYERAIMIHRSNYDESTKNSELDKCLSEVSELNIEIESLRLHGKEIGGREDYMPIPLLGVRSSENPVIVLTEIGSHVDYEFTFAMLASLKTMNLLRPISVVTFVTSENQCSWLARRSLDALGLSDVPVGMGTAVDVDPVVDKQFYGRSFDRVCSCAWESGMQLMVRSLRSVSSKSVKLLCLGCLTDAVRLIKDNESLFVEKVKEVVLVRGKVFDCADDNSRSVSDPAKLLYTACKKHRIPTTTLIRGAPCAWEVSSAFVDEICKTEHIVATNIRRFYMSKLSQLWTKANFSPSDPRRERLPVQCDRRWFCRRFMEKEEINLDNDSSVWKHVTKLMLYDPLALLVCIPGFRETYYQWETQDINGASHRVLVTLGTDAAITHTLNEEYCSLCRLAFQTALQNIFRQP